MASTYEELIAKARELEAAGKTDEARRVAEIAVKRRGVPQSSGPQLPQGEYLEGAPEDFFLDPRTGGMTSRDMIKRNMDMGTGRAMATGAAQGASLEMGDEITGAIAAGMPGRLSEGSMADRARFGTEFSRAANEKARENPWAYYPPYILGGAGTTAAGWGAAGVSPVGQTALGSVGRNMGMGAAEGALIGAAEGEGIRDRIASALTMGTIGAGAGAVMQPVAWAGQKLGRGAADIVTGAYEGITGKGNANKAGRALAATLDRSGRSIDDVADDVARAAAEGQPEYRVMDALGRAGQRRASGVVRAGGDGAEELAQFLDQRGVDAADRMVNFVDDAFPQRRVSEVAQRWTGAADAPTAPRSAAQSTDMLKGARGEAADAAYNAARGNAGPVDVRGAVTAIDERIAGMSGSNVKGDRIDSVLSRYRNRLIASPAPDGELSRELSDFDRVLGVKQALQDDIGAAVRAGRNNEARELGKIVSELDSALEASSSGYRAANDSFRAMSRTVDAVDEGATMARRGRPTDTTTRFAGMKPDEQIAARAGYGDQVAGELERTRAAAPDVARAFASTKRNAEAAAMAENPNLFLRRVGREGDMNATMKRALGGSLTADNLQDVADLGPIAAAGRAAADATQGRIMSAAGNVAGAVAPYVTGTSEGTRKLIADALMSPNPRAALQQAVKSTEMSANERMLISTLLRSAIRQPAVEATR